jgi:hypothetical protein
MLISNQCMGCQADFPIGKDDNHQLYSGETVQCTKHRYPPDQPEPTSNNTHQWIPTSFNISTLSMPVIKRTESTIFLRLPRELWRALDKCCCNSCRKNGGNGWWDTLAISVNKPSGNDFSWVVHMPEVV